MIFKLFWREISNARGFAFIFIFNMTLGLLGFVTLNSFRESLDEKLQERAKGMLTADLALSGRRNLTDNELKKVQAYLEPYLEKSSTNTQIYSMVKAISRENKEGGRVRLTQLKGVDDNYPLYGTLKSKEGRELKDLFDKKAVWVSAELSYQLGVKEGDEVQIGDHLFAVDAVVGEDSTTSFQGVGLAPKLYIPQDKLLETGLISFGSIATYERFFKFKNELKVNATQIREGVLDAIDDPSIRVSLPENSSEQVGRVLGYLTDYLGLVALVALFLSGIGASYLFQSFLFSRFKEIGVLKSLGLTKNKILSLYFLQVAFLGLAASLFALFLSFLLFPLVEKVFISNLGIELSIFLSLKTIFLTLVVGGVSSILVSWPVLTKVLSHPTTELFSDIQLFKWNWKGKDVLLFFPIILLFWGLSIWQSHSIKVGSLFTGAIFVSSVLFLILFPLFLGLVEKIFFGKVQNLKSPLGFRFSMGLRNLVRHRLSSTLSFLALGIGVMLMSLIIQLEESLKGELVESNEERASLFLFDIQEDQAEEFSYFAEVEKLPLNHLAPMIRGRIKKINDVAFKREEDDNNFATREERNEARFRNRGINVSYAKGLNSSERLIKGPDFPGPFDESKQKLPYISLEKRYAERMNLEIGDKVSFDIMGVEIEAEVLNFRSVRWTSFMPNFFILFQPGVLEDAPKTFLAAMGEMSTERNFEVQDLVVESFSNVSIINVKELIEQILKVFGLMSEAIMTMAILCLVVGFVVLYAITEHQTRRRAKEMSLYKVLGLEISKIHHFLIIEFLLMALCAIVSGFILSMGLGKIVAVLFFDNVWTIDIISLLIVGSFVIMITLLTVFYASRKILRQSASRFLLDDAN